MADGRSFIKPEYYENEIRRARVLAAIDELIEAEAGHKPRQKPPLIRNNPPTTRSTEL